MTLKYEKLTLTYSDDKTYLIVSECEKDAVDVVIPDEIDGVPVGAIEANAFSDCKTLISVVVPDNPDTLREIADIYGFEIGDHAFDGCGALISVTLPYSVSSIGHGAFRYCTSLEEIWIPDCYIGPYAFCHCESLKKVNEIDIISDGMFSHCKSLETFPVMAGTKDIGEDAFEHCYALTEAVIPASVKRIEPMAFRNCHNLKSVIFESPEDWYSRSRYTGESRPIDLLDPEKNAHALKWMDFDDGCGGWYKETEGDRKPQKSLEEILKEIEEWNEKQNSEK